MITMDMLASFFGWMLVVNMVVLAIAASAVTMFRPWVIRAHARTTGVDPEALPALYFQYMGNYKIAAIVLNLAPYIALRIML